MEIAKKQEGSYDPAQRESKKSAPPSAPGASFGACTDTGVRAMRGGI